MTEKMREKLRFRSWHRGTREMDLLMGSFADRYLPDFSDEELAAYEALLVCNDPELYDWITGAQPVPDEYDNAVTRKLKEHQYKTK